MSLWAKLVIAGGVAFLISPAALVVGWFRDANALLWVSLALMLLSLALVIGALVGYIMSRSRNQIQA